MPQSEKIKEQNKARQAKYLEDPENAKKHAAANKASYEKRKLKKKEVSFANPYGEHPKDEEMDKALKEHLRSVSTTKEITKKTKIKQPIFFTEIKNIIIDKVTAKSSQEMYINSMKRILKLFETDDLIKVIYDKNLVDKITKDRPINTAKADLQALLKIIDTFPISISVKIKSEIKTAFDVLKEKSNEKSAEPKENVITFDEYIEKVENKFGKDSKQNVVANLYHEVPLRDDMQLKIVNSIKFTKNTEYNYLILNKSAKGRVIVHNYKTSKNLGAVDKKLSTKLTKLIKEYVESKEEKEYLFTDKKMTGYIQKMNKAIGLTGGTNLLRHMAVNEFDGDSKKAEEKVALAQTMGHSVSTQKKYKQTKKIKLH